MTYDIRPMKAPRAAGALLRALARTLELPFPGNRLAARLLRDAGVDRLRETPCDTDLPAGPLLPVPEAPELAGISIEELAATASGPPAGGFGAITAADRIGAFRAGSASPVAVAEAVLDATTRSDAATPPLRAFIAQDRDDVLRQAEASQARWRAGRPLGPLDGVPVAVKDELDQAGYPTTVGTRFLGGTPASGDATVVARLRAAGAVLVGKANMHEIGIGVTGLNPHHGTARNPHAPDHATGGSSSGPAAAVAAGLCPLAVGADGGGSIRIPSALCGIVGLKATFGRVSEHGAAPLCWSVAHVGPMGATVRDVALGYAVMAGPDPADPGSLRQPSVRLERLDAVDLRGTRIGVFRPWFEDAEPEVVARCHAAVDLLVAAGAERVEVTIPELDLIRVAHVVTIVSEMAASQERYRAAHRADYAADTRINLALARRLSAWDYVHAQRHRARLTRRFLELFRDVDVLVTPTTARTAPPLRPDALRSGESDLAVTDQIMRFAAAGNLVGVPAISVPAGYDAAGLPIGLQIMGRPWDEHRLLQLAAVVESSVPRRKPAVHFPLL